MGMGSAEKPAGSELSDDLNFLVEGRLQFFQESMNMLGWRSRNAAAEVTDTVVEAAGGHERTSMTETGRRLDTANRVPDW